MGGAKDEDFCFLGVEFQAALLHPGGDSFHPFLEIASGDVGFLVRRG